MMPKQQKIRFAILGGAVALVLLIFVYQLMLIQIAQGEDYAARATRGYTATQSIPAARGEIVDRYGRPFTTNRIGFNIVLDRAFLPTSRQNQVILDLISQMEEMDAAWIDNLPLSWEEPFAYLPDQDAEVARLKRHLGVAEYASAQESFSWLAERYGLGTYDPDTGVCTLLDRYKKEVVGTWDAATARKLVGVRYEMEQKAFSLRNTYTFAEDVGTRGATIISGFNYQLPGVSVVQGTVREFVEGDLAPHIIGITGPISATEMDKLEDDGKLYSVDNPGGYRGDERIGKFGIEQRYEDQLRGTEGVRTITLDSKGNVVGVEETVPPTPGKTIVLTLDKDLQRTAQDALADTIADLRTKTTINNGMNANAGSVVAVDVATGEILAAATYPSYDNATYYQDYNALSAQRPEPLLNRTTMGTYRPGSIYKGAMAVAGLAEGVIAPRETIYCGGVYTRFRDYPARCLYVNGNIDVVGALQVSCNIFFYETGYRLGIQRQNEYSAHFGLGSRTGIELPELSGQLSSPATQQAGGHTWSDGNIIQSAIGQLDHQFTPMQMASYAATLASGGTRMQLHLTKSIKSYSFEETVEEFQPTVVDQVPASPEIFAVVREGMIRATQPGGTSYWHWTGFPLTVASKTGTPESSGDNLDSCYIAYIPAEDPKIAIAVVIEKGGQGYTGAPVARAIAEQYFFGSTDTELVEQTGGLLP